MTTTHELWLYMAKAKDKKVIEKSAKTEATEFAVIETGGKQYVVSAGDSIKIERLGDTFKVGDKVTFDKVLLIDNGKETTIGTPSISNAKVEAKVEKIGRDRTIDVIKYKQKSRYFKKNGHRQHYFVVRIESIK